MSECASVDNIKIVLEVAKTGEVASLIENLACAAKKLDTCATFRKSRDRKEVTMELRDIEDILEEYLVPFVVRTHLDWDTTDALREYITVIPQPDFAGGIERAVGLEPV